MEEKNILMKWFISIPFHERIVRKTPQDQR